MRFTGAGTEDEVSRIVEFLRHGQAGHSESILDLPERAGGGETEKAAKTTGLR
jgi:hypothetical protein